MGEEVTKNARLGTGLAFASLAVALFEAAVPPIPYRAVFLGALALLTFFLGASDTPTSILVHWSHVVWAGARSLGGKLSGLRDARVLRGVTLLVVLFSAAVLGLPLLGFGTVSGSGRIGRMEVRSKVDRGSDSVEMQLTFDGPADQLDEEMTLFVRSSSGSELEEPLEFHSAEGVQRADVSIDRRLANPLRRSGILDWEVRSGSEGLGVALPSGRIQLAYEPTFDGSLARDLIQNDWKLMDSRLEVDATAFGQQAVVVFPELVDLGSGVRIRVELMLGEPPHESPTVEIFALGLGDLASVSVAASVAGDERDGLVLRIGRDEIRLETPLGSEASQLFDSPVIHAGEAFEVELTVLPAAKGRGIEVMASVDSDSQLLPKKHVRTAPLDLTEERRTQPVFLVADQVDAEARSLRVEYL